MARTSGVLSTINGICLVVYLVFRDTCALLGSPGFIKSRSARVRARVQLRRLRGGVLDHPGIKSLRCGFVRNQDKSVSVQPYQHSIRYQQHKMKYPSTAWGQVSLLLGFSQYLTTRLTFAYQFALTGLLRYFLYQLGHFQNCLPK